MIVAGDDDVQRLGIVHDPFPRNTAEQQRELYAGNMPRNCARIVSFKVAFRNFYTAFVCCLISQSGQLATFSRNLRVQNRPRSVTRILPLPKSRSIWITASNCYSLRADSRSCRWSFMLRGGIGIPETLDQPAETAESSCRK